jgi:hypothetical protein
MKPGIGLVRASLKKCFGVANRLRKDEERNIDNPDFLQCSGAGQNCHWTWCQLAFSGAAATVT